MAWRIFDKKLSPNIPFLTVRAVYFRISTNFPSYPEKMAMKPDSPDPPSHDSSMSQQSNEQYDQMQFNQSKRKWFLQEKQKLISLREAKLKAAEMKWTPTLQSVIKAKEEDCQKINRGFAQQMQFLQRMEHDFHQADAATRERSSTFPNAQVESVNRMSVHATRGRSSTFPRMRQPPRTQMRQQKLKNLSLLLKQNEIHYLQVQKEIH